MPKTWNQELSEWMGKENKTQGEFSRETGIAQSCISDYVNEKVKKVSEERRRELYEATKLECFKPGFKPELEEDLGVDIKNVLRGLDDLKSDVEAVVAKISTDDKYRLLKTKLQPSLEERISTISDLFYMFLDQLQYFKNSTPEERRQFAESIDPTHVGYLTSLLNTLYKPDDQFQLWIYSTHFPYRGSRMKSDRR